MRDMVGYGANPPDPKWPGNARLAVQIVMNYEEGSEYSIPDGDGFSEMYLTEVPGASLGPGKRDLIVESVYEYGSRAGFWRLMRIFAERKLPITVFGAALALERNPEAARAIRDAGYEVCSHGYRWVGFQDMSEAQEREEMRKAVASITQTIGERPYGWYCRYAPSRTRGAWSLKRAAFSTTRTPTTMTCRTGSRCPDATIWWCPIPSTRTTCGSPPHRDSMPASSFSTI